jgi:hypothetical protein
VPGACQKLCAYRPRLPSPDALTIPISMSFVCQHLVSVLTPCIVACRTMRGPLSMLPSQLPFVPVVRSPQLWAQLSTQIPSGPAVPGTERRHASATTGGILAWLSPWQVSSNSSGYPPNPCSHHHSRYAGERQHTTAHILLHACTPHPLEARFPHELLFSLLCGLCHSNLPFDSC